MDSAAYFRTDNEFLWYRGGSHSDTFGDPSTGGSQLKRLGNSGNLVIADTLSQGSDRDVKQDFAPVDVQEVLAKVAALPIQFWADNNAPGVKHVGPMAQDFHATFGLGETDTAIGAVDAASVALAAIQGLNQKLEQKLEQKETEITELKTRLEKLERLLSAANMKGN